MRTKQKYNNIDNGLERLLIQSVLQMIGFVLYLLLKLFLAYFRPFYVCVKD